MLDCSFCVFLLSLWKGFEIKFLSYYFETKLADTAATCFSSSQFAKKLTLRMKIKLKDSSPLAKLPIAKRKDKNRFWKTKLLHTHYTTRYIYRVIQPIRSWPTEPQKVALLSNRNVVSERGILIVDFLQWETNILTNCIIKICCTHWPA